MISMYPRFNRVLLGCKNVFIGLLRSIGPINASKASSVDAGMFYKDSGPLKLSVNG